MKISTKQIGQCLLVLLKTITVPRHYIFWIYFTILISFIKHPKTIFDRTDPDSKNNFLSNYLPHNIVVKDPHGLFFIARPGFEELARFLFSERVAKWEPISIIKPKEGDIIIDLGANTGYYTMRLSSIVGKNGKIIAVEANPETCTILRKNCDLNHIQNVEIKNIAISDSESKVILHQSKTHSGISSIFNKEFNKSKMNDLTIQATTLDKLLEERFPIVNWIKVDVEGAELAVLRGCENILKITRNILIEIHEHILKQNNENYEEVLDILKKNGFSITLFNEYWNSDESPNQGLKSDYVLGQKIF